MATELGNKWANRLDARFQQEFIEQRGWSDEEVRWEMDEDNATHYIWRFEHEGQNFKMSIDKATNEITVQEV